MGGEGALGGLQSTGVRQLLQQQWRVGKQRGHCSHTHNHIVQQVWPRPAHVRAGSSVSLISYIDRHFHLLQMTNPPSLKQHLILLIQLRSVPGMRERFHVARQIYCYLIRPTVKGN